jgi:hypothetical protein
MTRKEAIEILTDANLYRRDDEVPSMYRVPNGKKLGEAIDFAVSFMKKTI